MSYDRERIVSVASVKLTEAESALISAHAKLRGTKVESIASELLHYYIKQHVKLQLLDPPTEEELMETAKQFNLDAHEK